MYQYKMAHLRRVRNGDTLTVVLDLGFSVTTQVTVRLTGAETPEYGTFDRFGADEGAAARDYTLSWFKEHPAPFTVSTDRDRRGDYFGTIYDAEGKSLNEDLVTNNFARAYQ
jgi:endonuclease YncB( thermonuclease family)